MVDKVEIRAEPCIRLNQHLVTLIDDSNTSVVPAVSVPVLFEDHKPKSIMCDKYDYTGRRCKLTGSSACIYSMWMPLR